MNVDKTKIMISEYGCKTMMMTTGTMSLYQKVQTGVYLMGFRVFAHILNVPVVSFCSPFHFSYVLCVCFGILLFSRCSDNQGRV